MPSYSEIIKPVSTSPETLKFQRITALTESKNDLSADQRVEQISTLYSSPSPAHSTLPIGNAALVKAPAKD